MRQCRYKSFGVLILILLGFSFKSAAQTCTAAGTCSSIAAGGGSETIDKFGTCRVVTNNHATQAIMVPYATAGEWSGASGFVLNSPATVSLGSCGADTVPEALVFPDTYDFDLAISQDTVATINTSIVLWFELVSGTAAGTTITLNGTSQGTLGTGRAVTVVNGDVVAIRTACAIADRIAKIRVKYTNTSGAIVNGNSDIDMDCASTSSNISNSSNCPNVRCMNPN